MIDFSQIGYYSIFWQATVFLFRDYYLSFVFD